MYFNLKQSNVFLMIDIGRWSNVVATLEQHCSNVVSMLEYCCRMLEQRCYHRWTDDVCACTSIDAATLPTNVAATSLLTISPTLTSVVKQCWTNVGQTMYAGTHSINAPTLNQHWTSIARRHWTNVEKLVGLTMYAHAHSIDDATLAANVAACSNVIFDD